MKTDAIETILDTLTGRRDLTGVLFVDAKIKEARAELAALREERDGLREAGKLCQIELAYLIEQTKSRKGGSVDRAYQAMCTALGQEDAGKEAPMKDEKLDKGCLEAARVILIGLGGRRADGKMFQFHVREGAKLIMRETNLAALREERDGLHEAGRRLAGVLPTDEIDLAREVWGNTNANCVQLRVDELKAVLDQIDLAREDAGG